MLETTSFHRPVNQQDLDLITATGWRFLLRLPQPSFHFVLNREI